MALLFFLLLVSRWSSQFGPHRAGSPELHSMLAEYIYSESPEVVCLATSTLFALPHSCA